MPGSNGFRHQDYSSIPMPESYELITPTNLVGGVMETKTREDLARVGDIFQSRRVSRIILVHGTLMGSDALGWFGHWKTLAPGLSAELKSAYKSVVDRMAGDRGNFSMEYANLLSELLNQNSLQSKNTSAIKVERFHWTGENHHLGRADAAVRLALYLIQLAELGEERVLLLGHSHAGNVFALVTNLLEQESAGIGAFFEAASHFKVIDGRVDITKWKVLESKLRGSDWKRPKIDIVTMGTPVRYGWSSDGFENLLHFVNHHPVKGTEPFRAWVPQDPRQALAAANGEYGDLVQQSFIARTDFPPAYWSWDAWSANRKLRNLLEGSELKNKRIWRFKQGRRVHDGGKTLLADYAIADETATDVAGHWIYTQTDWLAWHLNEIADRFYLTRESS